MNMTRVIRSLPALLLSVALAVGLLTAVAPTAAACPQNPLPGTPGCKQMEGPVQPLGHEKRAMSEKDAVRTGAKGSRIPVFPDPGARSNPVVTGGWDPGAANIGGGKYGNCQNSMNPGCDGSAPKSEPRDGNDGGSNFWKHLAELFT